jgi:hypothetical protein
MELPELCGKYSPNNWKSVDFPSKSKIAEVTVVVVAFSLMVWGDVDHESLLISAGFGVGAFGLGIARYFRSHRS